MTPTLFAAGLVLLVGALVQGAVGYGMNLVVAPAFALLDPGLVPAPLLMVSCVHGFLAGVRELSHADWRGIGWAITGRLPGVALGVLVVALLPPGPFAVAVGLSVLICVGLSSLSWCPSPTPRTLVVAGIASGTFGTATTIGGPPIALVYQQCAGATIRATMAVYLAVGSLTSVAGLAIGGQIHGSPLRAAAVLLPFLVAGFLLSNPLRRYLDASWMRPAVLIVAASGAIALVLRAFTF